MKKVAAINDMSGYGRCSLTVALPIISAYGLQCCPLPTAILSNHTGYDNYFFDDYTDRMEEYFHNWQQLGLQFECIYTGFLGSAKQIDIVERFIYAFKKNTLLLVDPVMGDHGKIYSTYTDEMCAKMKRLALEADIITPNLTEACILADAPYKEDMDDEQIRAIATKIHLMGAKEVVITGIHGVGEVKNFVLSSDRYIASPIVPVQYSGTGDLFASCLCGNVLNGIDITQATEKSADFVYKAALYTYHDGGEPKDGVNFETLLHELRKDKK